MFPRVLYTPQQRPDVLPDDPARIAVARMDVRAMRALVREDLAALTALVRAEVGKTTSGSAVRIDGRTFG